MHTRHVLFSLWLEYFRWVLSRFKYWKVNPTVTYKEGRNLSQLRCLQVERFGRVDLDWIKLLGSGSHDWAQWLYNRLHIRVPHLLSSVVRCNLRTQQEVYHQPWPLNFQNQNQKLFQNQKLKQIYVFSVLSTENKLLEGRNRKYRNDKFVMCVGRMWIQMT